MFPMQIRPGMLPEQRLEGELISVSLLFKEMKNEVLPTADILVNGRKGTALVDTGCT